MSAYFTFSEITFERKSKSWVLAKGDIRNISKKNYQTAMFKLTLFENDKLLWTGNIKVRGFRMGANKSFEYQLENIKLRDVKQISKYEIEFESGY
jgi:hypothetical protein